MTTPGLTPAVKARIAFMRFGLGPKPGGAARIGMQTNSARDACLRELNNATSAQVPESSIKVFSTEANAEIEVSYEKACWVGLNQRKDPMDPMEDIRPTPQDILAAERAARYAKHMSPEVGFLERLVLFWANHFSVFESKAELVRATAGHLERSVIRPNVLGKFSDMLKGVITHPAMIVYLDNHLSVGPKSKIAWRRSYNENLAREILELHTVGVGAGYSQEDVTNFARILTGWTVYHFKHAKAGQFYFNPDMHEPGAFTVMGQNFAQAGQAQGLAVLDFLANHPSTAQFIAFKLLLHFVTDNPSEEMVNRLAAVFRSTQGDLKAVAAELINMPESWSEPMNRLRQPYPWMVSQMRGMGLDEKAAVAQNNSLRTFLQSINHLTYRCMTPDGYADENYVWENPNAIRMRKDVAGAFVAGCISGTPSKRWTGPRPADLAVQLLPGALSPQSAAEIAYWTNPRDALNILFVTPEYLRR